MKRKITGCCSRCDAEVFEVLERDAERMPKRIGAPLENAVRVTFVMVDGTLMDLTFCRECADALTPEELQWLWRRVVKSWIDQSGADHPWLKTQAANGLLAVHHARPWKEVA